MSTKKNPENKNGDTHNQGDVQNQIGSAHVGKDLNITHHSNVTNHITNNNPAPPKKNLAPYLAVSAVIAALATIAYFASNRGSLPGTSHTKASVRPVKEAKNGQIVCQPQKARLRVDVAHFVKANQAPSFAIKLARKIKQGLPPQHQQLVAVNRYRNYLFGKDETQEVAKLTGQKCKYRGLVVYGDRNATKGNESLTCQVDVVDVVKQTSHELEEPPSSFRFSIPDHARYVSFFVTGLIKYYLDVNDEASRDFEMFLSEITGNNEASNKRLVSYCKSYLGRIAFEQGNKVRALRLFREANLLQKSEANTKNIRLLLSLGNEGESAEADHNKPEGLKASLQQEEAKQKLPKKLRDALENPETKILRLGNHSLSELPQAIARLQNLTKLYLTQNKLTSLPAGIAQLQNLTHLYMRHNQLETVPGSLTQAKKLTNLYLDGNKLRSITSDIAKLQNLVSLHLKKNQLTTLPKAIARLKKLKYLSLTGNPISGEELQKIRKWLPRCTVTF